MCQKSSKCACRRWPTGCHRARDAQRRPLVSRSRRPVRGSRCTGSRRGLTFTNFTAFRASIGQAVYEREYTKTILNSVTDPLVVLDDNLHVQTANRAFYDCFGASREQAQGIPLASFGDDDWKASALWSALKSTLLDDREFQTMEIDATSRAWGAESSCSTLAASFVTTMPWSCVISGHHSSQAGRASAARKRSPIPHALRVDGRGLLCHRSDFR